MTQVQETLVAWREAEQRLHAATDPEAIASLTAEVERLRAKRLPPVWRTDPIRT